MTPGPARGLGERSRTIPPLLVVTDTALMGSDPCAAVRSLVRVPPPAPLATTAPSPTAAPSPSAQTTPASAQTTPGSTLAPSDAWPWLLQWREKDAPPRATYARLLALADLPDLPLVVNDRVDLALALGRGVHLTEASLPTRVVRALLPAGTLLGRSTHDLVAAVRAAAEGTDYIVFGPIFDTPSKRVYGPPRGLEALAEVTAAVPVPVFAIGGIDVDRIAACRAAGAHGIAVIRALWADPDPGAALVRLLTALAAPVR